MSGVQCKRESSGHGQIRVPQMPVSCVCMHSNIDRIECAHSVELFGGMEDGFCVFVWTAL